MQATPQEFFDGINAIFDLRLDAAASADNAKCKKFLTKDQDGLNSSWKDGTWLNPPWGDLESWLAKANVEASKGNLVVALVPMRSNRPYWHREVIESQFASCFALEGGLRFGDHKSNYPQPVCLIVFAPKGRTFSADTEERLAQLGLRHLGGAPLIAKRLAA